MLSINIFSIFAALCVTAATSKDLPSFIKKCSRDDPLSEVTKCILSQVATVQPIFAKGLPEYGIESLDPFKLGDITVKAGTFTITNTDTVLLGLSKMELKDMVWDVPNLKGYVTIAGNLTLKSDYDVDGVLFLVEIQSRGQCTVHMYNVDIKISYKYRILKGDDGEEHWEIYDVKTNQNFGTGKFILTKLLGGGTLGKTMNDVFNENYGELMKEVGPTYVKAISKKIIGMFNKLYSQIPYKQIM